MSKFKSHLAKYALLAWKTRSVADSVYDACEHIRDALDQGSKLLVAGNGGSAADASHFVAELVVQYNMFRRALAALSLTSDSAVITASANDFGFGKVFERQVEALGNPGDVFLGITTSGKSENIIKAIRKANEMGLLTICLTSEKIDEDLVPAHVMIKIPHKDTALIQEMHKAILHYIASELEISAANEV